ncbi:MAG TPA: heparinase II/III family protein [Bacteroidales bacterium]|nr:heparinase II/III family protein [Bacteroidales bacterium]
MCKQIFLITVLFVGVTLFSSFTDVTKSDIDKAINKSKLKHPYLYFSDEDKPAMMNRIKNDAESRNVMNRLLAEANMLLSMPVDRNIPTQGKNTRAGWTELDRNRGYEFYYLNTRANALTLAFVYQMTGEQKYADKAFEFADSFCDLTTWTMRPHEFPIIYSRIMPYNVPDDQVNFSFDHYNGDSGRIMAAVYDWLYPALTVAQRDRIRGALLEKVITRVRGNYEFHWWATAYRCNWCGVCNSGVGLAGLALLTENPQLTDVVSESYNRINSLFNELDIDGGWQEGGGYWRYGISTSVFFADALKRATNSKYNLFENERLKSNPSAFPVYISVPGKGSVNFEDSPGGKMGESSMYNKLADETKDGLTAWFRNEFFEEGTDMFDIIWPKSSVKPEAPKNASRHFRTIDWWVMRSDFKNQDNVLVAGKAGKNDDPHHGHLDIGHFIVNWKGDYFITDIGSGAYDEKYFDDVRWDYPQASSLGHNVVFVNGEKQLPGKMRKQPYNYNIGGKVLKFTSSEKRDYVLMDPTNAYPGIEMKGWRRHIILEKPVITVVVDEVKSAPGSEIEVRFHPGVETKINGNYVLMTGKSGTMALIPVSDQEVAIREGKHASKPVNATIPLSWIKYFGTIVKANKDNTLIATIILPVNDDNEAQTICRSISKSVDAKGDFRLSFTKGDKEYKYVYNKEKDGLCLENQN